MNSEKYLMGIDLGTSVCKSAIFGVDGSVHALARGAYPVESPHPGWAEQDPNLWWSEVARTIRENLAKTKIAPQDIIGVGCCGMSRGASFIGHDGRVLRKGLIWMDRRAVPQEQWIRAHFHFPYERQSTEQSLTAIAPTVAAKILWVKENEPELWNATDKILLPKSFLGWKFTSQFVEEPQDAVLTNLFDRDLNDWSDDALAVYGIPRDKLAEIKKPWDIAGGVTAQAAKETGLVKGTPVVVGAWDGDCQTYGAGLVKPGMVLDRTGTVGRLTVAVEKPPGSLGFTLVPHVTYVSSNNIRTAGVSYQWARDQLCEPEKLLAITLGTEAYQLMDREAETMEPGAGGLFFVPYLQGRSGPANRFGLIFGITLETRRAQILRAVMEGLAYELRSGKEQIQSSQKIECQEIWTTGGAGKSRTWNQIKADILGVAYCRMNVEETGCLGAAVIAGYGVGVYRDLVTPIETIVKVMERTEPRLEYATRYDALFQAYTKLNWVLGQSGIDDMLAYALEKSGL